jgi:hypothetical protein
VGRCLLGPLARTVLRLGLAPSLGLLVKSWSLLIAAHNGGDEMRARLR